MGRFEKETAEVDKIIGLIQKIREVRLKMEIAPAKRITLVAKDNKNIDILKKAEPVLSKMVNIERVEVLPDSDTINFVTELGEVGFLKAEAVDTEKEKARIAKDIEKMDAEIALLGGRLNNPNFVSRAPAALVAKEKERYEFLLESRAALEKKLKDL